MSKKGKANAADVEKHEAEAQAAKLAEQLVRDDAERRAQQAEAAPAAEASRPGGADDAQSQDPESVRGLDDAGPDADAPAAPGDASADDAGAAGDGQEGDDAPDWPIDAGGAGQPADDADGGQMPGTHAPAGDAADAETDPAPADEDGQDHTADALAYTMMGIDLGSEDTATGAVTEIGGEIALETPLDINALAAAGAASIAFGTANRELMYSMRLDQGWIGPIGGKHGDDPNGAAACAAAFLRKAGDVPAETLTIHLRRSGYELPETSARARVAWSVFGYTLRALDELDAAALAAAQAAARQDTRTGPRPARRDELAMQPADTNPLSQLGRRMQQRAR